MNSPSLFAPLAHWISFVILLLLPLEEAAQGQQLFHYWLDNGNVIIYYYGGSAAELTIPRTIKGLLVTGLGDYAFAGSRDLTSVSIPDSVTSIGNHVFEGASKLTGVSLPKSLTRIGDFAFASCTNLRELTLPPNLLSLGINAFSSCSKLTAVTIPRSVTSIGTSAFGDDESLTAIEVDTVNPNYSSLDGVLFDRNRASLVQCPGGKAGIYTIPDGVIRLEARTFAGCTRLTSVSIPNSVTNIPDQAFAGCALLTSVFVGSSVSHIGEGAFAGCASLTAIDVDPANTVYSSVDGVLLNKAQTAVILFPESKGGSYLVPLGVTIIPNGLFQGRTRLTNVTIGDHVTTIGWSAFSGCTRLAAITVDAQNPAYSSFDGVLFDKSQTSLLYVPLAKAGSCVLPDTVTYIGAQAFEGRTRLTSVWIPRMVTEIASEAFDGCPNLTALTVDPENMTYSSLDGVLFNKSQTTLIRCPLGKAGTYAIPETVTVIQGRTCSFVYPGWLCAGAGAFQDCTRLTSVTIPNSVTSIGNSAFLGCSSLTSVAIRNSVTSLGDGAFDGCSSLTNVTLGNGAVFWPRICLEGPVTIPDTIDGLPVTAIWQGAFSGCTKLTSVTIPNSVTSIGLRAFGGCTSLTNITIPDSVTTIGGSAFQGCASLTGVTIPKSVTSIGDSVFAGCTGLTAIAVDTLNAVYSSLDGVLLNKSQTTLIRCPPGKAGTYRVPSSVTDISGGSCWINPWAGGFVCLGDPAFGGCASVTSVTIGSSVTTIGDWVFEDCVSLISVTIPDSVTSIGQYAFWGCTSLSGVYFVGNAPALSAEVFQSGNPTVYYLPGTIGWDTAFGGGPTALWLPQMQASDVRFGVQTNRFGFNISWASDRVVVVEAANDLTKPVWSPVSTNTLARGTSYFNDLRWAEHPRRFYRVRAQ